jgi:hypothetical protein
LKKFSEEKVFHRWLRNTFELTKKYWKNLPQAFTSYLYDDLEPFDNYLGRLIKLLRSFFNYLVTENGMYIG